MFSRTRPKLLAQILCLFCLLAAASLADDDRQTAVYLRLADEHHRAGRKDSARKLYEQAAMRGSAEGHFALFYKYTLDDAASLYHMTEAAVRGHGDALDYLLDRLVFRANSLTVANPQRALEVYHQAMKANPNLSLFDQREKLAIIKMCLEAPAFDVQAFIKTYGIHREVPGDGFSPYRIWELAEEASRGGRFGKPDPALVFNLVIRGGFVPAEFYSAVREAHKNWKSGTVKEFKICNHITSAIGANYCASRAGEKEQKAQEKRLDGIRGRLRPGHDKQVSDAYDAAIRFIELKAATEGKHSGGGSWPLFWMRTSISEQKEEYVETMEKVAKGFTPESPPALKDSDRELNEVYQKVLRAKVLDGSLNVIEPERIRSVQRRWLAYRDTSAALFFTLNPKLGLGRWKSWLTVLRTDQLRELPED